MAKSMDIPPAKSVAFQIRRAHLAFDRLLTIRLNRHGIKSGFWHYLRALWIEEGLTQKRLSQITHVTEVTTVSLLNDMTHRGLIQRERDTADRRQVFVNLTPKGRALKKRILPYATELNKIAIRGIPKEDIELCLAVFSKMASNLEAEFKESESLK
jgi:MarR family transcriptional regulator, organic hydroperoxide resistance regulator